MANAIRIDNGVKRIEVNDNGEVILLPVSDDSFLRGFYALIDEAQKKVADVKTDSGDIIEFDRYMVNKIDGLFGAETCRKVFGEVLPGVDMILEFFSLITPYLEEYRRDRAAAMSKYSAERRGSSV